MAVTIYVVVGPASGWADPSAAQVKAGQLAGGGAATWADSTADPGGTGTISWPDGATTGLTPGVSYRTAYVASDGTTDGPVSVSDVWAAAASVALASTGGAGTFAGIAGATSSAALAVTGASGAFAGAASSPAVATLAATGSSGTLAATASSPAVAALSVDGASGTFAGSAGTGTSASLVVTGGSGVFAASAQSVSSASLASTGSSGDFSALASTVGTATLDATGGSGWFVGSAVSITTAWLDSLGDSGTFNGSASVAAPSTIGRPTSDTSNSGWTASTGSDLYAMLDEETPDSSDYIVATSVGVVCELALNTTAYPGTASQVLRFRASSSTGNSLIVRLKNTGGATVRSATQTLTAVDTEYAITLTAGEIAAITSGALSVELESA